MEADLINPHAFTAVSARLGSHQGLEHGQCRRVGQIQRRHPARSPPQPVHFGTFAGQVYAPGSTSGGHAVGDPAKQILDFAGASFHDREFCRREAAETPVGRTHPFARVMLAAEDVCGHTVQTHKPEKPVRFVGGETAAAFSPLKSAGGDIEGFLQQRLRNLVLRGEPDHLAGGKAAADHLDHVGDRVAAAKGLKGVEPEIPGRNGELFVFGLTSHDTALHEIVIRRSAQVE